MSFAVPGALLLLGLALPVILLYVLKVRLRRINVSTNLFWKQIYEEKPPRSLWQYFRHLMSLLLQLLFLAFLVFSVADPYFPWQLLQARRIVAVIDNSASMQATDIKPTRFQAAIESALATVEGLRFRDQMAIVLSGPTPEVVMGMTSHAPTLKRALRDLSVSENPTELQHAIALGEKLIGEHPRGQIMVYTDGCHKAIQDVTTEELAADPLALADSMDEPTFGSANGAGLAGDSVRSPTTQNANDGETSTTSKKVSVDFRVFGQRSPNVGITQFQARRSLIDPMGYQLLAAVENASDHPAKCRLEIELDGAPVDIVPLELEPNEVWSRSIEKTSLAGGTLTGRLTEFEATSNDEHADVAAPVPNQDDTAFPNQLECDDVAQAILPGREVQNVLVVTQGNLFLRKAFEANPLVQVRLATDFPESWPADTIVVFDREIPKQLPHNDVFVVDPAASCDLWELGEPLRDPIVTDQDKHSPLMKHVRLDNVLMPEARKIAIKGKSRTLAGALMKDPVYAEVQREASGKCLVLTVNLEKSDLAFRTAFPIMVTNALGWFAGTSGELREAAATGETVAFEWPSKHDRELRLTSPEGVVSVFRAPDLPNNETDEAGAAEGTDSPLDDPEPVTLGPFNHAGIWSVHEVAKPSDAPESNEAVTTAEAKPLAQFAVNVSNRRETDLRPPEALLHGQDTKPLMAGLLARPVWFYLVVAGCILSVIEWFLYQRRVIA